MFLSKKSLGLKIDSNLNIRNHNNKIIVPKELKLKNIQKEIRKPITPKCQLKWDTFYEKKFNWISIWYILNKIKCKQSTGYSSVSALLEQLFYYYDF
jgi:late competence protein required for DNA uptake (superfamily II DNA/RNA helicase)